MYDKKFKHKSEKKENIKDISDSNPKANTDSKVLNFK